MTDKKILSPEQRSSLCGSADCTEHGDGDKKCSIPLYKDDLLEQLEKEVSASSLKENVTTKTATGKVE